MICYVFAPQGENFFFEIGVIRTSRIVPLLRHLVLWLLFWRFLYCKSRRYQLLFGLVRSCTGRIVRIRIYTRP